MNEAVIHGESNLTSMNVTLQKVDELYEVPLSVIIILSICYGTVSVVAVSGNLCVLWIVATSPTMKTVTNFFIANLACADIIIGVFAIPFHFQAALLQRWVLPSFMCPFCPFVEVLSVNVSTFTLTAIALDRYRAIMDPLRAHSTKLRAKAVIFGIWVIAFSVGVPYAVAFRVVLKKENGKPLCVNTGIPLFEWRLYNHVLVSLQYFIPLFVISYSYCRMGFRLRNSRTPGNAEDSRDSTVIRNKRKVIKMLFIVVALFAICWLPFQTYNILQELIPSINYYRYINVIWFCCHWLAMSNSCYNPFIYAIYNERFNKEFKSKLRDCFKIFQIKDESHYDTSLSSRYE